VDACRSETDSRPLNSLLSPGIEHLESTLSLVQITENANPQDPPIPRELPFVGWLLLEYPRVCGRGILSARDSHSLRERETHEKDKVGLCWQRVPGVVGRIEFGRGQ
jgi:hypothetical protein